MHAMAPSREDMADLRRSAEALSNFPHALDMEYLVDVARQAGAAIMEVYGESTEDWDVQTKGDESPVTKADLKANAVICDALTAKFPSVAITSEENKKVPWEERKSYVYSWNIDPLDGTKEFIKRNGQFATNIALLKGQEAVVGLVQIPVTGQTYWAAKGLGAYVRSSDDAETKLECKEFDESDKGLTIIVSRRHRSQESEDFVKRYDDPKFIQMGSSLKFTRIAENAAHVYPRMAPTCEWDTAAPHVIVTEAGGEVLQCGVCDADGVLQEPWEEALARQNPVVYNKENDLNPFFVAYGKRTRKNKEGANQA